MAQIKVIYGVSILVSACSHHACETGVVYTELANRDSRHYRCCHSITVRAVDSRCRSVPNNIYNGKHDRCLSLSTAFRHCCEGNRRAAIRRQHLRHQAKVQSYDSGSSQPSMAGIPGYVMYSLVYGSQETDAELTFPSANFIPADGTHSRSMNNNQPYRPK